MKDVVESAADILHSHMWINKRNTSCNDDTHGLGSGPFKGIESGSGAERDSQPAILVAEADFEFSTSRNPSAGGFSQFQRHHIRVAATPDLKLDYTASQLYPSSQCPIKWKI